MILCASFRCWYRHVNCNHLRQYPPRFGARTAKLLEEFLRTRHETIQLAPHERQQHAEDVFESMAWGDTWEDARMSSVVAYLHGNRNMKLPKVWRKMFPSTL